MSERKCYDRVNNNSSTVYKMFSWKVCTTFFGVISETDEEISVFMFYDCIYVLFVNITYYVYVVWI